MKQERAPLILPRIGLLPRITCSPGVKQRITKVIHAAGYQVPSAMPARLEDLYALQPEEVATNAVSRLLHRKWDSTPLPTFRTMVCDGRRSSRLRKALEVLLAELPDNDYCVPWTQLRAEYTGGDPFGEGLAHNGDLGREDYWNAQLHPRALKEAAATYLRLMDILAVKSAGRRPPEVPERLFVMELAHYWTQTLGLAILNGRGPGKQQHGAFARFVRAVASFYRECLMQVPLDKRRSLKIGSLDGHIRSIADQIRQKAA